MKKNEKLKGKISFYFGLFCNHTPSLEGIEFFLKKMKIEKEKIAKISYRGSGWPGSMKIFKKDEKILEYPFPFFWNIAGSAFFSLPMCQNCEKCTSELSDLSFGDPWLSEFKNEIKGKTLIICRNQQGENILKKAQKEGVIKLENISGEKVVASQFKMFHSKKRKTKKKDFFNSIFFKKIILRMPLKIFILYEKAKAHFYFSRK